MNPERREGEEKRSRRDKSDELQDGKLIEARNYFERWIDLISHLIFGLILYNLLG